MKPDSSRHKKLIALLICMILPACAAVIYLVSKKPAEKPKYEVESHLSFSDVTGVIRIENPYGLVQLLPSDDHVLRVEVTKITRTAKFLHKEGGLPQIELKHEQNGPNIDFELRYHSPGGPNLYTDMFLFCPPVKKIEVNSSQGNIWVGAVRSNVTLLSEGNNPQIAVSGLKGDLDLIANEGELRIDVVDNHSTNVLFNKANTKLAFIGKNPGPTIVTARKGRIATSFIEGASAQLKIITRGTFFSNLSETDLKEGKFKSDGSPIIKQIGQNGNLVELHLQKGEITVDQEGRIEPGEKHIE